MRLDPRFLSDRAGEYFPLPPAMFFSTGKGPLQYGTLAGIRSLGRCGLDVYLATATPIHIARASRYTKRNFAMPAYGRDNRASLVRALINASTEIGRVPILFCVDDEAAILVAEEQDVLAPHFLFPRVPAAVVRALSDKHLLHKWCEANGIASPTSVHCTSPEEVKNAAGSLGYPFFVKNNAPITRVTAPVGPLTSVVSNDRQLQKLLAKWQPGSEVILQELIPGDPSSTWLVTAYVGDEFGNAEFYTGRKLRSWPRDNGVATAAITECNETLLRAAQRLFYTSGFRGIADTDWRYDERDGKYKLIDFNPRLGAVFRLFASTSGWDVVRSMYFDLAVGDRFAFFGGEQSTRPKALTVETIDILARLFGQKNAAVAEATELERAWFSTDDPLPWLISMAALPLYILREIPNRVKARTGS